MASEARRNGVTSPRSRLQISFTLAPRASASSTQSKLMAFTPSISLNDSRLTAGTRANLSSSLLLGSGWRGLEGFECGLDGS